MKVHDKGRSFFNLNLTLGFPSYPQLENEFWIAEGLFPVFFSDYPAPFHRLPGEFRISRRGTRIDRGIAIKFVQGKARRARFEHPRAALDLDISINPIGFVESSLSSLRPSHRHHKLPFSVSFEDSPRSARLPGSTLFINLHRGTLAAHSLFYHVLPSTSPPLVFSGPVYLSRCCAQLAPLIKS